MAEVALHPNTAQIAQHIPGWLMNPQMGLSWGSALAARLPRGVAEGLSDAVATVAAQFPSRGLRHLRENLQQVLPSVPARVIYGAARSYGRYYLGFMRLAHSELSDAIGPVRMHGVEDVETSLRRGRGVLLLGAHFGNWDVAGMAVARHFGGLVVYVERLQPESLYQFYRRTRSRHGLDVVIAGSGSMQARRTLARNGLVGMIIDRTFGSDAVRVPFGSGEIEVPTAGIRMALRAGAAVHTTFAIRCGDGYECRMQPELLPQSLAARPFLQERHELDTAVLRVAQVYATRLQELIRLHPDQWCMLHPTVPASGSTT